MDPFSIAMMVASAALAATARRRRPRQKRAAVEAQHRQLAAQNMATEGRPAESAQEFQPVRKAQDQIAGPDPAIPGAAERSRSPRRALGRAGDFRHGGLPCQQGLEVTGAEANRKLAALFSRIGSAGQLRVAMRR